MGASLPTAGREAAHGLLVQLKKLNGHWADLPSMALPAPPIDPLYLRHTLPNHPFLKG